MGRSEDSSKVGAFLGEVPSLSGEVQRLSDVSEGDKRVGRVEIEREEKGGGGLNNVTGVGK